MSEFFSKSVVGAMAVGSVLAWTPMEADAATVTFSGLTTGDLNALTPVANISPTSSTGGFFDNVTGNQSSGGTLIARSPWEGSIHQATGEFSSVQGGGTATYTFATVQNSLSLIWGSPDTYNDVTITLIGGGGTDIINGSAVQGPDGILASLVDITDVQFTSFVLDSGNTNAFEYANLKTTPVPLPAGGLLLLTALGGVAALRRKRKTA